MVTASGHAFVSVVKLVWAAAVSNLDCCGDYEVGSVFDKPIGGAYPYLYLDIFRGKVLEGWMKEHFKTMCFPFHLNWVGPGTGEQPRKLAKILLLRYWSRQQSFQIGGGKDAGAARRMFPTLITWAYAYVTL